MKSTKPRSKKPTNPSRPLPRGWTKRQIRNLQRAQIALIKRRYWEWLKTPAGRSGEAAS
jgi:hypothetical protein